MNKLTLLITILLIGTIVGLAAWDHWNNSEIKEEQNNSVGIFSWGDITMAPDDGFRAITWDYNYGGKEWKYFTMLNADCREVRCECMDRGCVAYCLECFDANVEVD